MNKKFYLLLSILLFSSLSLASNVKNLEEFIVSGHTLSPGSNVQEGNASDTSDDLYGLGPRPKYVQDHVDEFFKKISQHDPKKWCSNGKKNYPLLSSEQDINTIVAFIKSRINVGQTDINIMDIGAGDGSWGRNLTRRINELPEIPDNIYVSIYSLTGEKYDIEQTVQDGKCSIHHLSGFKIEDMDKEFRDRNIILNNKFDLIVSDLTFCHLYDPLKVLQIAVNALKSYTGIMINQWVQLNLIKNEKDISSNTSKIEANQNLSYFRDVVTRSKLELLISPSIGSNEACVLKRNTDNEVRFPYRYLEDQQLSTNLLRCPYVVDQDYDGELVPFMKLSGSKVIFDELRGYNRRFNEIYGESSEFTPLPN